MEEIWSLEAYEEKNEVRGETQWKRGTVPENQEHKKGDGYIIFPVSKTLILDYEGGGGGGSTVSPAKTHAHTYSDNHHTTM